MNKISTEAKQELQIILKEEMGELAYNEMFNSLCEKLDTFKQQLHLKFKNHSDEDYRTAIIIEYLSQVENDEDVDIKITLCEIVLDTILTN